MLRRTRELLDKEWAMSGRAWVYGRRACRRCGGTVTVLQVGPPGQERPAYLCANCQR
jgi:endonuclease-8